MEDVKELDNIVFGMGGALLVSILVLMEDVKELETCVQTNTLRFPVSILVLMEDVKELLMQDLSGSWPIGFNPCFNGRCKRTKVIDLALKD